MATNTQLPQIHLISVSEVNRETAIFGYHIPHLPDFLADHTLLDDRPAGRLNEVFGRLTRFVTGLRKRRDSAFALRFLSHPAEGRIDIVLLGRVNEARGQAKIQAEQMAADLAVHLAAYGLPALPLPASNSQRLNLRRVLFPFQGPAPILEIRQHEEIVPLSTSESEAYVVYPFWGPGGDLLEPFECMLRQPAPAAISIHLEPTELTIAEVMELSRAAQVAETMKDQIRRTYSEVSARQIRDPGAELVARIYKAYNRSLVEPFMLVTQVLSPEANTAWTVARSLGTAFTSGREESRDLGDDRTLPSRTDVVAPENQGQLAAARRTFTTLIHLPWGPSLASPGKERLPYLVGASGASAAFRFPISMRGGVPGVAVLQRPPDFETGPRRATVAPDELHLGSFRRGGAVTVKLKALTRHGLITGFTGSGKTNTMLYLLDQLWTRQQIPFLVIESAKKEYRGFLGRNGFEDLLIFTLGDETTTPFRLNPFELLNGVRLEAHLGRLQTCFDGALPQFGILPSIIAESLEGIYREKGWKLTDRGGDLDLPLPTMRDMFRKAVQVSESRGYAGETYQNIRAAVSGRIGGLLRGSKGRMFGAQRSYPLDVLMERPVILELNDLNADDKSLTIMFLLMLLREYRELHPGSTLQHITVVEEAHNVMGNITPTGPSEISADTRSQAVQAFADLLTEVRSYGEGILIADQSPDKLVPDAVRNTNLQIAHQLRDAKDRESIGRALIMDQAQQDYLGKLAIGEAAVFMTGMEKATFMQVPEYKEGAGFEHPPVDSSVRQHMSSFTKEYLSAHLPFDGCRFCGSPCQYMEVIEPQTREPELHEQFTEALLGFEEQPEPEMWPENWENVARVCATAAEQAGQHDVVDAAYCYLAHEIDFPFTKHMRQQFADAYERLRA